MERKATLTKSVIVPSGYSITLKGLTYGDKKAIRRSILGDNEATETTPKITVAQAEDFLSENVFRSITDWDITESDGSKTPITLENIEAILSQEDMNFLMTEINQSQDKKK